MEPVNERREKCPSGETGPQQGPWTKPLGLSFFRRGRLHQDFDTGASRTLPFQESHLLTLMIHCRPHQWWLEADQPPPPGRAPPYSAYPTRNPALPSAKLRSVRQGVLLENRIPVGETGKEAGPGVGHAPSRKRRVASYIPFWASDPCSCFPSLCLFTRPLSALSTRWPLLCWSRSLTCTQRLSGFESLALLSSRLRGEARGPSWSIPAGTSSPGPHR
nr:uncharacterized protein LOC105723437 [Aotus nancymaae]